MLPYLLLYLFDFIMRSDFLHKQAACMRLEYFLLGMEDDNIPVLNRRCWPSPLCEGSSEVGTLQNVESLGYVPVIILGSFELSW